MKIIWIRSHWVSLVIRAFARKVISSSTDEPGHSQELYDLNKALMK